MVRWATLGTASAFRLIRINTYKSRMTWADVQGSMRLKRLIHNTYLRQLDSDDPRCVYNGREAYVDSIADIRALCSSS